MSSEDSLLLEIDTMMLLFNRRHLSITGNVLDVGCGPGHITGYLQSLGVDALGLDMVAEFIAHAKAAHPHGRYQLGSMTHLDVANNSIAGILAWFSLIHLPPTDLDAVLAEFRRVMTATGLMPRSQQLWMNYELNRQACVHLLTRR